MQCVRMNSIRSVGPKVLMYMSNVYNLKYTGTNPAIRIVGWTQHCRGSPKKENEPQHRIQLVLEDCAMY